jgi:hypothetical protein
MKPFIFIALALALGACRGESPPRDYQNAPPAMTHPPQNKGESPAAKGMPAPSPEPSSGPEERISATAPVTPPVTATVTTTIEDQAPPTKTHT